MGTGSLSSDKNPSKQTDEFFYKSREIRSVESMVFRECRKKDSLLPVYERWLLVFNTLAAKEHQLVNKGTSAWFKWIDSNVPCDEEHLNDKLII